jgi:hypothetical protein
MKNAWKSLLYSRKFWLLVMDTVISLVLFFVGKYGGANLFEDMKFIILTLQPMFVMVIYAIAKEDAAAKESGNFYHR